MFVARKTLPWSPSVGRKTKKPVPQFMEFGSVSCVTSTVLRRKASSTTWPPVPSCELHCGPATTSVRTRTMASTSAERRILRPYPFPPSFLHIGSAIRTRHHAPMKLVDVLADLHVGYRISPCSGAATNSTETKPDTRTLLNRLTSMRPPRQFYDDVYRVVKSRVE